MPITLLRTIDIHQNECEFYFDNDVLPQNNLLKYKIYSSIEEANNPFALFFQFDIRIIGENEYKVEMMSAGDNPVFLAKGIPDEFILRAHELLGGSLVSSSNHPDFKSSATESRNTSASKVWRRLLFSGHASYDSERWQWYLLDQPMLDDNINIVFSTCSLCGIQLPNVDVEWKIEHCLNLHKENKTSEDLTTDQFANRLFTII